MTRRTPAKKKPDPVEGETDEELDALLHNRGMAQRNVCRIQTTLQQAAAESTELTLAQIKVYQRSIDHANVEFTRLHQDIIARTPTAKREDEDNTFFEFASLYEEVSVLLENSLSKFVVHPGLQPQLSNSQQSPTTCQPSTNQQPLIIQPSLPRAIPTFDGRYEQWEKFKVMFKDVVDRSNEPDRIKLYHLERSLVGDAAGLIDAKTITDGNYERAWQLLDERYSDNRRMVDRHLAGLLGLKKLSRESYSELRSLVEAFEGHVENLKFLGRDFADISEYMIIFLVARALDDETKKLWESTMKKGELPSYSETVEFLKERVSVLERCQRACDGNQFKHRPPMKSTPSKYSLLKSNTATASASVEQRCDFCADNHLTFKCPAFNELSVSQRIAKVKEKNVCFNCLRRGHRVSECSSKKSCSKCQRRHHSLLHLDDAVLSPKYSSEAKHQRNSAVPSAGSTTRDRNPVPECQPSTSGVSPNAIHSSVPMRSTSQVFLLTARVGLLFWEIFVTF